MRAGSLDRRIELQSRTPPTAGDPTADVFAAAATVWAEKLDARGVERFIGSQFLSESEQAYRVRYRTDVDPTWRVKDGAELWRVVAAHEGKGRRTETVIQVRRFDPNDES